MATQREFIHRGLRDPRAGLVLAGVELDLDPQAFRGSGIADRFHVCLKGPQRLSAPILGDVAEEAMLDLVPLLASSMRRCFAVGSISRICIEADSPQPQRGLRPPDK